jgi:anti-sigma factor RsiW
MSSHPDSSPSRTSGHPPGARLEAYAAGELEAAQREAMELHLAGCARCRSEAEGWALLFGELEALPERGPDTDFSARVMAEIQDLTVPDPASRPVPVVPQVSGIRSLVGRASDRAGDLLWGAARALRRPGRSAGPADSGVRHLTPSGIQDYLEGRLAARTEVRVREHLAHCPDCTGGIESWSLVLARLDALPRLAPAADFADRVMAQVQVEAVAAVAARTTRAAPQGASLGTRMAAAARRLLPSTRRGWILAGGVAAAPTVGLVALVAAVVGNPMVGAGDLLTFLGWRATDLLGSLATAALAFFTETRLAGALWQALLGLAQASPLALAALFLGAMACLASASVVVYRNLYRPQPRGETHVQALS